MSMKKYLPVLVMILLPSVSANKDVYCEAEASNVYIRGIVNCRNVSIQENEAIGVSNQFQNKIFTDINLISVSADVDNNTLQYFPEVYAIEILDSNISSFSLPSGIRYLNVTNSIFPRVTGELLVGCENLTHLTFISNYGLQFDEDAFKHLRLHKLTIVNQTLPKLKRDIFEGLQKLSHLYLISDNIQEIDKDTFNDLPNLRSLYLDGNPIETFNVNMSGAVKLRTLSLFNTNLNSLNFDVLSSLQKLGRIRLSGPLLKNTNATQLITKVPGLIIVDVLSEELQRPEVVSFVDELKKKEILVWTIDKMWTDHP